MKQYITHANEAQATIQLMQSFLTRCIDKMTCADVQESIARLQTYIPSQSVPSITLCPLCGKATKRMGFTAAKKQRYVCINVQCLKYRRVFVPNAVRGRYRISNKRKQEIVEQFSQGHGIRETARITNAAKAIVRQLWYVYCKKYGEPLCACGSPASHRGWCKVRYQNSKSRQKLMQKWHNRYATQQVSEVLSGA